MVVSRVIKSGKSSKKTKKTENSDSIKKVSCKKKIVSSNLRNDVDIKWDKILEKVEKMVEKNWKNTEENIRKRKSERDPDDYKNVNLDVMVSRISEQSKVRKNVSLVKNILYFMYFLVIVVILILVAKWLLLSQNW